MIESLLDIKLEDDKINMTILNSDQIFGILEYPFDHKGIKFTPKNYRH